MIQVIIRTDRDGWRKKYDLYKQRFILWWWINKDKEWFRKTLRFIRYIIYLLMLFVTIKAAI